MVRIALVAHDDKKDELVAWALKNRERLSHHELWGTGTTGGRVVEGTGLAVTRLLSGPLGGDAELGAMIAERKIDVLVFFIDPLTAQPHDVDIKALIRLATLYNTLFAVNHASADAILAAL
jgi:methylglyoxal synthase